MLHVRMSRNESTTHKAYVGLRNGWVKCVNADTMAVEGDGVLAHDGESGGVCEIWDDKKLGKRLLTCGYEGDVTIWNTESWKGLSKVKEGLNMIGIEGHPESSV